MMYGEGSPSTQVIHAQVPSSLLLHMRTSAESVSRVYSLKLR